jgi:hypothetical protein
MLVNDGNIGRNGIDYLPKQPEDGSVRLGLLFGNLLTRLSIY